MLNLKVKECGVRIILYQILCDFSDLECYMYENSETGECQKEHPSEQDMDICCTPPPLPSSPYSSPPQSSLSPDNR